MERDFGVAKREEGAKGFCRGHWFLKDLSTDYAEFMDGGLD